MAGVPVFNTRIDAPVIVHPASIAVDVWQIGGDVSVPFLPLPKKTIPQERPSHGLYSVLVDGSGRGT